MDRRESCRPQNALSSTDKFLVKCKLVRHRSTPAIYNKILEEKNVRLKMQTHKMSLNEEVGNLDLDKELRWSQ